MLGPALSWSSMWLAGVYWSKGWWRWWWQLDCWSYKSCKAPVKSSPPRNQHGVFFTGRMPFLSPTNSVKALKGKYHRVSTSWWSYFARRASVSGTSEGKRHRFTVVLLSCRSHSESGWSASLPLLERDDTGSVGRPTRQSMAFVA